MLQVFNCLSRETYLLQFQKTYFRVFLNPYGPLPLLLSPGQNPLQIWWLFHCWRVETVCSTLDFAIGLLGLFPADWSCEVLFYMLCATYQEWVALSRIKRKNCRIFSEDWRASCVLTMALDVRGGPCLSVSALREWDCLPVLGSVYQERSGDPLFSCLKRGTSWRAWQLIALRVSLTHAQLNLEDSQWDGNC